MKSEKRKVKNNSLVASGQSIGIDFGFIKKWRIYECVCAILAFYTEGSIF
jgi:hypothetical protein